MRKRNRPPSKEIQKDVPPSNSDYSFKAWHHGVLILLTLLIYSNSLSCGFVFDDASAVVDNQDLRSHIQPWWILFFNDFWGTPMAHESSHKSYRPLTVLTYRWNFALAGLEAWTYHLVNMLLHTFVVHLFYRFSQCFLDTSGSMASALLFALHPVHVEAVTGVVGRAELLSAVFLFASLLIYLNLVGVEEVTVFSETCHLLTVSLLVILGTLCKEQCITVVGVCLAYDFVFHFIKTFYARILAGRMAWKAWMRLGLRFLILSLTSGLFLLARVQLMGSQLPHFTAFDNPAAHAPPLARRLTHLHLVYVNLALLFYPSGLCADWTMGTIALITTATDPRNIATFAAFAGLVAVALRCASPRTSPRQAHALSMGLALLALPYMPASNLFFYVGFVVAERVLYVPSAGFCLIMGLGFQYLLQKCRQHRQIGLFHSRAIAYLLLAIVCSGFSLKTFYRNYDWRDEYSLFTSALKVNQRNAKLWNNVGHALEARLQFDEALLYFQQAVRVQPDDMGARINVGRTLVQLGRLEEAEDVYYQAMEFFPKPKKGKVYHTRVSPKDLTIFINLANLLSKNDSRLDEADALLRRAISLREDNVDAYQNRGSILVQQRRFVEAEDMYRKALRYKYTSPALHYNLGVVLLETNRSDEAYASFNQALQFDPHHEQTLFALASAYSETADSVLHKKAMAFFEDLAGRNYEPIRVNFALAILYTDAGEFAKAAHHYRAVLEVDPSHRSSLFNLALMYHNELNNSMAAVPLLHRLIEYHPHHFKSYMLLGDIELSVLKNATAAIKVFEKAITLSPDSVQARHNHCVAVVEGTGDLEVGERCLREVAALANPADPTDAFVFRHLALLRAKRRGQT
ncbi:transmembrane and TPR repeat containing protein [Echinococcus multilocularis]|uniref:dolichyl-phosphate-mannose--protein mannosyltransferase n=1 Tax=Echinococcus multilocularis TaxID=6211 RepID=A0A068YKD4_ECHMU|nr:transmembrane and TPR repeat containing protein [Echinococcus multilocularis]